ncbi:MAG TPA: helix-turn-helix transcriptional regulator [Ramlibacter sp.]|jgi:DNA-binding CsgD family transcriptional regulator|uniref:helix-turn-helix transcriptional regulator n=1 Tax=Ramlibacter sp. TaxID=1917967 RepID=UPI002D26359E|nr:helix-turn-helix transcriptional regulator [Ramlibacter sp.]HZY17785.1 helix-turn-helix transcriptional regulator [Ramlibacter sp.]
MQRRRLSDDLAHADVRLAAALMDAIGAPDFARQLLDAVQPTLPASHCTIFGLRSNGRVDAISTASGVGEVATLTAVDYIRLGFDRKDTNMVWLARRKPGARRQFWLSHQLADDVADEAYRRVCYGETGIRERLSWLALWPDGLRVAVSLYRNHSFADYTPADFDWAGAQVALVATALVRHARLTPGAQPATGVPRDRMAHLPARERQLMACVLAGQTTRQAAQKMGISLTTALTYRYRAFQRLGVRNHRELLGLLDAAGSAGR